MLLLLLLLMRRDERGGAIIVVAGCRCCLLLLAVGCVARGRGRCSGGVGGEELLEKGAVHLLQLFGLFVARRVGELDNDGRRARLHCLRVMHRLDGVHRRLPLLICDEGATFCCFIINS